MRFRSFECFFSSPDELPNDNNIKSTARVDYLASLRKTVELQETYPYHCLGDLGVATALNLGNLLVSKFGTSKNEIV